MNESSLILKCVGTWNLDVYSRAFYSITRVVIVNTNPRVKRHLTNPTVGEADGISTGRDDWTSHESMNSSKIGDTTLYCDGFIVLKCIAHSKCGGGCRFQIQPNGILCISIWKCCVSKTCAGEICSWNITVWKSAINETWVSKIRIIKIAIWKIAINETWVNKLCSLQFTVWKIAIDKRLVRKVLVGIVSVRPILITVRRQELYSSLKSCPPNLSFSMSSRSFAVKTVR